MKCLRSHSALLRSAYAFLSPKREYLHTWFNIGAKKSSASKKCIAAKWHYLLPQSVVSSRLDYCENLMRITMKLHQAIG